MPIERLEENIEHTVFSSGSVDLMALAKECQETIALPRRGFLMNLSRSDNYDSDGKFSWGLNLIDLSKNEQLGLAPINQEYRRVEFTSQAKWTEIKGVERYQISGAKQSSRNKNLHPTNTTSFALWVPARENKIAMWFDSKETALAWVKQFFLDKQINISFGES